MYFCMAKKALVLGEHLVQYCSCADTKIFCRMFHTLELHLRLGSDIATPLERVKSRLQTWSVAFDIFLRQKTYHMNARDLRGSMVLKILSKVAYIMLHTLPSPFECSFDMHEKTFQEIVSLGQSVVDANSRPGFTFDLGIVAPLYWTASRCRNPSIRRQAIAILRSSPRVEGVWESGRAAKFAEKLIEIEEEGLGIVTSSDQVPESARIRIAAADFYPDQRMVSFKYTYYPYDETMLKEMWLSWSAAPTPRAGIYPRLTAQTVPSRKYLADGNWEDRIDSTVDHPKPDIFTRMTEPTASMATTATQPRNQDSAQYGTYCVIKPSMP